MITLATRNEFRRDIKKSRFIATAVPISAVEEAPGLVEELALRKATHNAWAYKSGDAYRFFDDGEVGGTAGRPILSAIEGQGLDRVFVMVTRFFGGIRLGAGGLVRAYGGTAAKCLDAAPKREVKPIATLAVEVPFDLTGALYQALDSFPILERSEQYGETGLTLTVRLDADFADDLEQAVVDATKGRGGLLAELRISQPGFRPGD